MKFIVYVACAVGVFACTQTQSTVTETWSPPGGSDHLWSTGTNWNNGIVPNSTLVQTLFNSGGMCIVGGQNFTVQALRFSTVSSTIALSSADGSSIVVSGDGPLILSSAAANPTITVGLILAPTSPVPIIFRLDNTGATLQFRGAISGSADIFIESYSATQACSFLAPTTYVGTTTITGGTLYTTGGENYLSSNSSFVLSSNSGLGFISQLFIDGYNNQIQSLAGVALSNVTINGATLTTGADSISTTFAGVIQDGSSPGSIIQEGNGTWTLSGVNTYTGSTAISHGTLALSGTGSIAASSSVAISAGATLDCSATSGNVNLHTLSGDGTLNGNMQNLSIHQQSNGTFSGTIGAFNVLTLNGNAELTLPSAIGSYNYTGGVVIQSGTLGVDSVASFGTASPLTLTLEGAMPDSSHTIATLDILDSFTLPVSTTLNLQGISNRIFLEPMVDFTIDGAIQDLGGAPGGFTLDTSDGTEILTLTGTNTYSGGTVVSGGRLSVNGSIAGGIVVNSGATLGGIGTIFGGGVINGTLSPGNSIGPITFDTSGGNVTLGSSSVTNIEIEPGGSAKILVTGSGHLALGGTVHVAQDAGSYARSIEYSILEGAYTGEFNPTVTGGLPGYTFSLSYLPNFVYLLFGVEELSTNNLSGNDLAIADYLNQNGSFSTTALFVNLNESQLQSAMDSVSPARNAFGPYIVQQTAFSLSAVTTGHLDVFRTRREFVSKNSFMTALLADASDEVMMPVGNKQPENKFSVWASGFGEYAHQKASLQNPSFHYLSEGALGGFDYYGKNRDLIGGSVGYAHTHFSEDQNFGHGNISYYFASMYGNLFAGNFYVSPAVWGLFDQIENTRNISFPGFSAKAKANIFAWQLTPHLEVGYDASFSWGNVIPFSSATLVVTWQRGYQERGAAPLNARVKAKSSSMVRSETGLKFCEAWQCDWGAFFLREKLSYVFEKPFGTGAVNAAFVGTPGSFTVTAVNQNLNLGAVGLDFLFAIGKKKPVKVDLDYEGEFGSQYWSNQLTLTISKDF